MKTGSYRIHLAQVRRRFRLALTLMYAETNLRTLKGVSRNAETPLNRMRMKHTTNPNEAFSHCA